MAFCVKQWRNGVSGSKWQSAVSWHQRRLSLIINEMAKQAAQWRGVKAAAKISIEMWRKAKISIKQSCENGG
jgi:hypothetical protein